MLDLTNNEKTIITFLLVALLAGSIVHYCKVKSSGIVTYAPRPAEKEALLSQIVNINKAGKRDLTRLEGIGPGLAQRIVAYREKFGPFRLKADISNVKGIGPKTFEKIKDSITLE